MLYRFLSPAKIRLYCLFFILFLIGSTLLLMLLGMICPMNLISRAVEQPVIVVRENDLLRTGISQIVSDEDHLYILYGTYSVAQVYSLDGAYQYTVSVYNHTNGRTEITAWDGDLYVCDKVHNVYAFRDGKLIEFTDRTESFPLRQQLMFGGSDPDYTVQSGSVWYAPDGEPVRCVIERPAWLWVYQNGFLEVFLMVLFVLTGHLTFMPSLRVKGRF